MNGPFTTAYYECGQKQAIQFKTSTARVGFLISSDIDAATLAGLLRWAAEGLERGFDAGFRITEHE